MQSPIYALCNLQSTLGANFMNEILLIIYNFTAMIADAITLILRKGKE